MSGKGLFEELPHDSAWRGFLHVTGFTDFCFAATVVWFLSDAAGLNHDSAMFLYCGRLIVQGAVPYIDFVEVNPPLVMYLSAIPAWFTPSADLLIYTFNTFSTILFIYCLIGMDKSLKDYHKNISVTLRGLLVGVFIVFTYWLLVTAEVNYGQREHLFLMFYLPYFFLRIGRFDGAKIGPKLGILFGLAAGLGACLKPHFVFVLLFIEGFLVLSRRKIRPLVSPEFIAVVIFGLAYGFHFLLLPSEMRDALFERWIPMIVSGYGAYDVPLVQFLGSPAIYVALVLVGACSTFTAKSNLPGRNLVGPVSALTIASILAYLTQRKGWSYHQIPFLYGAAILGLFVCLNLFPKRLRKPFAAIEGQEKMSKVHVWTSILSFAFIFLLPLTFISFHPSHTERTRNPINFMLSNLFLTEDLRSEVPFDPGAARDPVLIISTSVAEVFPRVVDLDLEIASRYLWTFPIALLYADAPDYPEGFPYHPMDESPPEELQFLQELGDDIVNNEPKVIVIDYAGQAQGCPVGFNPADYLRVNGFVERYMTNYKEPLDIMGKKVYYRKDVYS